MSTVMERTSPRVSGGVDRHFFSPEGVSATSEKIFAGSRVESFIQDLSRQVTDGPALLAMLGGGLSFRLTRLASLKKLFANPLPSTLTQVWGRKTFANALALGAEALTFTGLSKGTRIALGEEEGSHWAAWRKEVGGTALMLGSLRFFGWTAGLMGKGLNRVAPFGGAHQTALSQLGMYTGIVVANGLEQDLGLRPELSGNPWSRALATLAHFNVAGCLVKKITPQAWHGWEQKLDRFSESLLQQKIASLNFPKNPSVSLPALRPALATAHPGENLNFMSEHRRDASKGRPVDIEPLRQYPSHFPDQRGVYLPPGFEYTEAWPHATRHALGRVWRHLGEAPALADLLKFTGIRKQEILDKGLQRLDYMLLHVHPLYPHGNYVDTITHKAMANILKKGDALALRRLLLTLNYGSSIQEYEAMLAPYLPDSHLMLWPHAGTNYWEMGDPHLLTIQRLALSKEAQKVLWRWFLDFKKPGPSSPEHIAPEVLFDLVEKFQWNPRYVEQMQRALIEAEKSPLSLQRIQRLGSILLAEGPLMESRLKELADPHLQILGQHSQKAPASVEALKDSQWDGYLGGDYPHQSLAEIHRRLPALLDPQEMEIRRERTRGVLQEVLARREQLKHLGREELAEAFQSLGDATSVEIARAILKNEFELRLLSRAEMESLLEQYHPYYDPDRGAGLGHYFYPGTVDLKAVMAIQTPVLEMYSHETAPSALYQVLRAVVHDYDHHKHMKPAAENTGGTLLRWEMSASARQWLWEAENGDPANLSQAASLGYGGFGLYFRNYFERNYDHWIPERP